MDIVRHEVLGCLQQRQSDISKMAAEITDNVARQFLKIITYM
jgi:hypothetical protein